MHFLSVIRLNSDRRPHQYKGPLRYKSPTLPPDEEFERHIWEDIHARIASGEAFSLHLLMDDYGTRKVRSLPYVDSDTLDLATEWFHDVQEGDLKAVTVARAHAAPHFPGSSEGKVGMF